MLLEAWTGTDAECTRIEGALCFTTASMGSCKGTLMGSLMGTWIGYSTGRQTRTLIGKEELGLDVQHIQIQHSTRCEDSLYKLTCDKT